MVLAVCFMLFLFGFLCGGIVFIGAAGVGLVGRVSVCMGYASARTCIGSSLTNLFAAY